MGMNIKIWQKMDNAASGRICMKVWMCLTAWPCLLALSIMALTACGSSDDDSSATTPSFTVLVYMMADYSMDSQVDYTLEQLKAGMRHKGVGKLVIYLDRDPAAPRLLTIDNKGEEKTLKTYDEENSANPATLMRVIGEAKAAAPSEHFGLVLWGHATGWLPGGYSQELTRMGSGKTSGLATRYMGFDGTPNEADPKTVMEIDQLAKALPDGVADYIWFDACLMANAETFYELRTKCRYLIGSPTVVLAEARYDVSGVPYSSVLRYMFGDREQLVKACRAYYDHYEGKKYASLRSCSITMVDASAMDDLFAATHELLSGRLADVQAIDTSTVQAYHCDTDPHAFFDLGDVVRHVSPSGSAADAFKASLSKAVVYHAASQYIMKKLYIDPSRSSGLTLYIPMKTWKNTKEYGYYFKEMGWKGVYE